ncbi:hypothetical protein MLD38_004691 [Melastoma candidum]|uniref:Uncharacterized protein n=1 Tax=Melastoma candidum TaxID=119954 RepID=A0ACB9S6L4_9MYRT|nr:hypothetical protein MLD38_004691 [Melastoma candidum]
MPLGRSRNKRATSSGSYASTITTIFFIALCVLGVWMLNSNSVMTPATTKRTTTSDTDTDVTAVRRMTRVEMTMIRLLRRVGPRRMARTETMKNKEAGKETMSTMGRGVMVIPREMKPRDWAAARQQEETTNTSQDHESSDTEDQNNKAKGSASTDGQQQEQKQENQVDGQSDKQDSQTQVEEQRIEPETQQEQLQEDSGGNNEESTSGSQESRATGEDKKSREESELQDDPRQSISAEEQQKRIQEQKQQRAEDQQKPETQQQEQQQQPTIEATSLDQEAHDELVPQETNIDAQQSDNAKEETTGDNTNSKSNEASFPSRGNSGIPQESKESKKSWKTQASQSENENERRQGGSEASDSQYGYAWVLCNVTAGPDYIPCLENEKALRQLRSTKHFEHRERHCPEEGPTCLVPTLEGYKRSIEWPKSRDKIWYHNVPHTKLAEVKGHQNWVKVTGEFLTFPGGGTQFIHGALHYIDFLQQSEPNIKWGKHTRVILDIGGKLLLELNRVLRPGGFFVWSATPVNQKLDEDVEIWKEMPALTSNMC